MAFFFVAFEYEPTRWRHVRNDGSGTTTWEANTSDDACGLAAIATGDNGKYLAIDVASTDLDVNQVQVQLAADMVNTTLDA